MYFGFYDKPFKSKVLFRGRAYHISKGLTIFYLNLGGDLDLKKVIALILFLF
jgi:hypothetical protein